MANEYAVNQADLTAVADAIRTKGETGAALPFPAGFVSAIQALAGAGGGASEGLAYDMGDFVIEADVNTVNFIPSRGYAIPHNLGEVPDFVLVWTDEYAGLAEPPYTSGGSVAGYIYMRGLTGAAIRATSSVNQSNPLFLSMTMNSNTTIVGVSVPSSASYGVYSPTADEIYGFAQGASVWWRGGTEFHYFVSKAWWNVGGDTDAA